MADKHASLVSNLKRKRPSKEDSFSEHHGPAGKTQDPGVTADREAREYYAKFVPESLSFLRSSDMAGFIDLLCGAINQILCLNSAPAVELFSKAVCEILPSNPLLPTQLLDVLNQIWSDLSPDSKALLQKLLQTFINQDILTHELAIELSDRDILQDLLLISNSQIFSTRSVRVNTSLLYKQQKFNLLREENEGYGKLSHEFNLALSDLPKAGAMDLSEIASRSEDLLTVVDALIGYFELDPNRVLDNILDICSQNLLSHSRFIMHFLHHSPWAPVTLATATPFAELNETEKRRQLDSIQVDFVKHYKTEMGREGGSRLAAQLLGFKLRYCSSTPSQRSSPAPESLIFLIALLIKSGFIKLSDIYSYLSPTDDEIKAEFKTWKEEMDDRAFFAKSNPLALAGALGDDETGDGVKPLPAESGEKISDKPKAIEMNQKVSLLHALLAVGCIPAALQLLSLHPQISGPHQFVSDGIHRLLHIAIDGIYRPYSPSRNFEQQTLGRLEMQKRRAATSRTSTGAIDWLDDLERKSVRGYSPFPRQEFGDRKIRFFLDEDIWTNDIPICETRDDFYTILINFLRFSGPRLGNDVRLMTKLARIGKGQFMDGSNSALFVQRWVEIARLCLIPAISLVGANPGVVNEVFDLIKYLPYPTRFSLYGEWQTSAYKVHSELKLKASETDKDTKGILRRISKQDVKRFGRALAKKSTSNPLILWAIAINQIEFYDNFVEVVVDAAKFCTNLGYDVLEFVILSSLANPFKNRVKEDGTSIAVWLTGLSAFCAKLFRRYGSMDVSTATTYVACQLKKSNIYDLIVLRDLVTQMAGVLVHENLSDHQLKCYAGGDSLKEQGMALLREPGMLLGWKKSGSRLMKALTETNLAGLLPVLIAQERGTSLFNLRTEHISNLKLLGNLFDECHGVLIQFHEFIVANLDLAAFETLLPSFETLVGLYGIDPSVGFYLWRPILVHKIRQYDADQAIQMQKKKLLKGLATNDKPGNSQDSEKNLSASIPVPRAEDGSVNKENEVFKPQERDEEINGRPPPQTPWHPALLGFIQDASRVLPTEVWAYMSPHFYTTFWQLSLYDISVPVQTYSQEVSKLTSEIKKKDADRSDMTVAAVQRRRRERERLQGLVDQINQDFKVQTAVYQSTKDRLLKERDFWFPGTTSTASESHCVIPRCLFGPNEAIYSAKFIKDMHKLGTKNFSSLTLFDKLFVNLHDTVIFTCTNREAENYGRFLREILGELARWYGDRSIYEKEAIGPSTPGFLKKWNINPSEAIYLQYEEFKSVMLKWHKYMTSGFRSCLESRDYMHVRNALAVLEKIITHYPQVDLHGSILEEKVDLIAGKSETRGDLQIRAQGYLALLRKSSKTLVTAAKFSTQNKPASSPGYPAGPERPSTPQNLSSETSALNTSIDRQPERVRSALNPTAPSFKPHDNTYRKSSDSPTQADSANTPSRRGHGAVTRGTGADSKPRQDRTEHTSAPEARTDVNNQQPNRNSRTSMDDVREDSTRSRTDLPREEAIKKSQAQNQGDVEPRSSTTWSGRSSRAHLESKSVTKEQPSRVALAREIDTQNKPVIRQDVAANSRIDSGVEAADLPPIQRNRSDGSSQGHVSSENRPRTPDGPRGNETSQISSSNVRVSGARDMPLARPMRYEANRSKNPTAGKSGQGFRAQPPTGPRASVGPSLPAQASNLNATRSQVTGRPAATTDSLRGPSTPLDSKSTPPPERSEIVSATKSTALGMNPDRAAMMGLASRESDAIALTRSVPTNEPRMNRNRITSIEGPLRTFNRENLHPSDAPRGPSDWKAHSRRDLQDEDPRRLSRGPDTWDHVALDAQRQGRVSGETGRAILSKSHESANRSAGTKIRPNPETDARDHDDAARTSLELRSEPTRRDLIEARKTRTPMMGDRQTDARSQRSPSHGNLTNDAKGATSSEKKSENIVGGRATEQSSKHIYGKETQSKRTSQAMTDSREQKDTPRDSKALAHRDEDNSLRRRDRENSRSNKDEARDSRHERPRDGHHVRASARRSPSGTNSDRGEKKERERESERRNGSRREVRDTEHRDKDRSSREFEHRRDGRDREHSSRDRESDSRRGSRKHERDRSVETLDRGTRSGDVIVGSNTGDSLLPSKRRRVGR